MALDAALVTNATMCTVGIMSFWGACLGLTYVITLYDAKDGHVLKDPTMRERLEATDLIFSLPFYFVIFALSAIASYEHWEDVNSRWHGTSTASWYFQMFYVVRMSTHSFIQWYVLAGNPKLRLQMTGHHLLSIICYGGGLVTTRMHFWACLDGLCEFTTIFLNIVFAFKTLSPKDDSKYALAKVGSGVVLWAGFVVFRLVLFPAWLWWFYLDITTNPAQTWDRVGMIERYFYAGVTVVLLGLSIMWFIPITKGMLKGVRAALGKGPTRKAE